MKVISKRHSGLVYLYLWSNRLYKKVVIYVRQTTVKLHLKDQMSRQIVPENLVIGKSAATLRANGLVRLVAELSRALRRANEC